MPFNSLKYFLFLPSVFLVCHCAGERARPWVLLAGSLLFYAALDVPYLSAVLLLVAASAYAFGLCLDRAETSRARLALLSGGIGSSLLVLAVLKYLPFMSDNLNAFATMLSLPVPSLPSKIFVTIGVSYYVFQSISYLFDIYYEIEKPERHFGYFLLYMAFFPKLLQGPIERAGDLLPQLRQSYRFNYENVRLGLLLFTWGLFKKVVIADRLGFYADAVYNDLHAYTGLPLLLGTYAYAFEIYLDFSGYTDMALGSGLLFNIKLTQNFNSPYLATSVAEFWRRWHISFSRWILDYIFKPLQMQWRNWKNWGTAAALMVAFLVSGLWHGARWGFIVWGGLHGLYLASSVLYRPSQKKLHKALGIQKSKLLRVWQVFVTFNLVSFAWIFFRAASLPDACYVVTHLMDGAKGGSLRLLMSQGRLEAIILILIVMVGVCADFNKGLLQLARFNTLGRHALYYLLAVTIILLGISENAGFIYFGF